MNINLIVISTFSIGAMGLLFGLLLAYAAKKFKIEVDSRIEQIEEALPGANCGACGYAGCTAYARTIVQSGVPITACTAGGKELSDQIADILGQEPEEDAESVVAHVRCVGDVDTVKKINDYNGVKSCIAVHATTGGNKACAYGCLGYGDCEDACPFDAIHVKENGLPKVDRDKCTGCGLCVGACPRIIIELVPKSAYFIINCVSKEFGPGVSKVCKKGCIGCGICVKVNDSRGIKMDGKLPVVDYKTFKGDKTGAEKCPPKVIGFNEITFEAKKRKENQ